MDRVRACPICPVCNSKKFRIIAKHNDDSGGGDKVMLECLQCSNRISV